MSQHQQKKKRKAQRAVAQQKDTGSQKREKRDLKSAMKELWQQEENRFLLICIAGLLVIFLSTSLPGKAGLYVQSAIIGIVIFLCIVRNVRKNEETADEAEKTEKEETEIEEDK